jgi:hypothetical protein
MFAIETGGIPVDHIRKVVRSRLLETEAVNLDALAAHAGQDRESVARIVEAMVADGEVEMLRPVGCARRQSADVFCRMLRQTDGDFRWEKEINTRPAKDEHAEMKKSWLRMSSHDNDLDLSVLNMIQTMNMA